MSEKPARGLPAWAEEMRAAFTSGTASQFVLHGNVSDLVARRKPGAEPGFLSLRDFLCEVMFDPFEVVVFFDRGTGLRVRKGADLFQNFLRFFDSFRRGSGGTGAGASASGQPDDMGDAAATLDLANLLPKDPRRALEIIDRFLKGGLQRTRKDESGTIVRNPVKAAVVVDWAQFIVPRGEALYVAGDMAETLIRILDWASDPAILGAQIATCLIAPNLMDLNQQVVESPYNVKIRIDLPDEAEALDFIRFLVRDVANFAERSELSPESLAAKVVGLTRVAIRHLVMGSLGAERKITAAEATRLKKQLIEKECAGRLEFVESPFTLENVAGHDAAKDWLRQDAKLLKAGRTKALPMGYLIAGRIGTGKTFLIECFAGECGIPVVELKNFREKWVGASEGNLEAIFNILHALGQVVVFVDEADQFTGKRGGGDGDSGLSGRIYAMLAKEMSDTKNRGRILWIFATSRPDLLEVDLKRQGRLDIHIALFPPQDAKARKDLLRAMGKKIGLAVAETDIPSTIDSLEIGGNEMEGLLVRAMRLFELREDPTQPLADILKTVFEEFRPSPHSERLEYQDLIAVKECTDARFLPEAYRKIEPDAVNRRLRQLKEAIQEA